MKNIKLIAAMSASFLALAAAPMLASAKPPNVATEAEIRSENARWAEAYARGDYEAIGELYTRDGMLLPPGEDRVEGPAAIAAYFRNRANSSGPNSVSFRNYEFYGDDKIVTEISDTEIRDHNGKLLSRGKQILIFIKKDGVWKLHRDIWNGNAQPKKEED